MSVCVCLGLCVPFVSVCPRLCGCRSFCLLCVCLALGMCICMCLDDPSLKCVCDIRLPMSVRVE